MFARRACILPMISSCQWLYFQEAEEVMSAMNAATICDFCGNQLDLGQEFVYQFESIKFAEDPVLLALIRRLPDYQGEPLRLCRSCRTGLEQNARDIENERATIDRTTPLARVVFILVLVVVLTAGLAAWLNSGRP
jgi:hypothetical protein